MLFLKNALQMMIWVSLSKKLRSLHSFKIKNGTEKKKKEIIGKETVLFLLLVDHARLQLILGFQII